MEPTQNSARLVELCQRAAVVACPYVDASQSGVVLTAFALGTPVVTSAVGGLPEYVEHGETGLLVPPGDSEALARALTLVLEDRGLRARLRSGIACRLEGDLGWSRSAA